MSRAQDDLRLMQAHALYQRFREEGAHPGENPRRPMKWGDSIIFRNNVALNQEYCFVDIGPFPMPVVVRLEHILVGADAFFGGLSQPQVQFRLVWNLGESAQSQEFPALPRHIVARSLQVYARRIQSGSSNEPAQMTYALWATPQEGQHAPPVPFLFQQFDLGIGTAIASLVGTVPRLATHVTAYCSTGENNKLFLTFRAPGATSDSWMPLAFTGAPGSAPALSQPLPIPFEASSYFFRRDVTTAALQYTLAWCR